MTSSSVFYVLEHADREYDGRGTVFGQCDEASLPVVTAISHALLSTDNHPAAGDCDQPYCGGEGG